MDFTDFMNSTNSHPLTALDNSLSLRRSKRKKITKKNRLCGLGCSRIAGKKEVKK